MWLKLTRKSTNCLGREMSMNQSRIWFSPITRKGRREVTGFTPATFQQANFVASRSFPLRRCFTFAVPGGGQLSIFHNRKLNGDVDQIEVQQTTEYEHIQVKTRSSPQWRPPHYVLNLWSPIYDISVWGTCGDREWAHSVARPCIPICSPLTNMVYLLPFRVI